MNRVYHLLVHQWVDYMEHLKTHYPYLFSLAMRTNPFDLQSSPIFR
jgi:voltage-gated potassium channel